MKPLLPTYFSSFNAGAFLLPYLRDTLQLGFGRFRTLNPLFLGGSQTILSRSDSDFRGLFAIPKNLIYEFFS